MFTTQKTTGAAMAGALACLLVLSVPPIEAAPPLSAERLDKRELVQMLKRGEYAALDHRLTEIQEGYRTGRLTEQYASNAFRAFGCADPTLAHNLDNWVDRFPRSVAAHIARGNYHRHFGFERRGTEFSNKTHRSQFVAMAAHFGQARESYEAALQIDDGLPEAYSGLIRMAMAHGGKQATTLAYQRALEAVPDATGPHRAFAFSLRPEWSGSPDVMRKFVEQAASKTDRVPGLVALRFYVDRYEAERAFYRSDYSGAIDRYSRILAQDFNAHDLYRRGRVYYYKQDEANAVRDLTRSLELSPNGPKSLHLLGLIKNRQGKHRDSVAHFTKSIHIEPHNPKYLLARADAYVALGQFEKAEADHERARECGSFNSKVHIARADFYTRYRHDHVKAAEAAGRLVRTAPLITKHWRRYTDALFVLQDCKFVDASARYLELCLSNKDCGKKEAAHIAVMANMIRNVSSCSG